MIASFNTGQAEAVCLFSSRRPRCFEYPAEYNGIPSEFVEATHQSNQTRVKLFCSATMQLGAPSFGLSSAVCTYEYPVSFCVDVSGTRKKQLRNGTQTLACCLKLLSGNA